MFENHLEFVKFNYLVSFKTDILFYFQDSFKIGSFNGMYILSFNMFISSAFVCPCVFFQL